MNKDCVCGHSFPMTCGACPHCGRQYFPNVSIACSPLEMRKLESRFAKAMEESGLNGSLSEFEDFKSECEKSHAVFAVTLERLFYQVGLETQVVQTYHQLEKSRLRETVDALRNWATLRPQAEAELLGSISHIEQLHYACLSLDWRTPSGYGDCVIRLKEGMILHRSSCFEGNTAVLYDELRSFENCLRSSWRDRGKLAAVVFSGRLRSGLRRDEFAGVLVQRGESSPQDKFIEVHVFGPMTIRTFEEVKLPSREKNPCYCDAIADKLKGASVVYAVDAGA